MLTSQWPSSSSLHKQHKGSLTAWAVYIKTVPYRMKNGELKVGSKSLGKWISGPDRCLSLISQNDQTLSGSMDLLSKPKGDTHMRARSRAQSGQMNCTAGSMSSARQSDLVWKHTNTPHSKFSGRCFGISDSINNGCLHPQISWAPTYSSVPSGTAPALYLG